MDLLDQAQTVEERDRERALAAFRRRQEIVSRRAGRPDCVDCHEAIEEERRKSIPNTVRCASCARLWAE